jgi:hypothetical protein
MAEILDVPIAYFFGDLRAGDAEISVEDRRWQDYLARPETIEFIRLYYAIPDGNVPRQFFDMVRSVSGTPAEAKL